MQTRIQATNQFISDEYIPSIHFLRFLADAIKGGYKATPEEKELLRRFWKRKPEPKIPIEESHSNGRMVEG